MEGVDVGETLASLEILFSRLMVVYLFSFFSFN